MLDDAVWSNADIEFPSTSTSDDIEIIQQNDAFPPIVELSELALDHASVHSVPVANAEVPTEALNCDAEQVKEDFDEPKEAQEAIESASSDSAIEEALADVEKKAEIVADIIQPSAPLIDDLPAVTELSKPKHVQYPNLHEMSRVEPNTLSGLQQSIHQRVVMKPFNESQLKELYHNPELMMAERYEADFISNELNGAYKEHPLYELIKKYSQSRYNLKMNMLDLQNYIKMVQVNLEDVWKISTQTIFFEGVCLDNERVQKSERYE